MTSSARLLESHRSVGNAFPLDMVSATTPRNASAVMGWHDVEWTYPWEEPVEYPHLGLTLNPYKTTDRAARMACFMSHFSLWLECVSEDETILIMEDDALFIEKLDPEPLMDSDFLAIGINDPRGATRKADLFHRHVQGQPDEICPVPTIDHAYVPQGLAGASAYLMKPEGAKEAVRLTRELGAWPNDALLCKQLCPWLGVTKTYYTKVQGTPSTL
jgi:hypothetical protein